MADQYDENTDIIEYWDARHRAWAEHPDWGNYAFKQGWFRERFAHLLTDERGRGSLVLDYGCGCGLYAAPLLEHYDRYIGIDTSPAAIELADKYYDAHPQRGRMSFASYRGRVGEIGAGWDLMCDLVISITVLQHQPGSFRLKMIEDIKRLLRPGIGRYIGLEWIGATAAYDMPAFGEGAWREAWLPYEIVFDILPDHPEWATDNVWYTR